MDFKKKKLFFWLITFLLPFFFLLLLEIVLRIFGLFPQPPLFIHKHNLIQVNPDVGERYFNKKQMPVPRLYPQTFSAQKKQNTVRIFCLGGSTTAGFPYDMTVPFPQQLTFMLQRDFPQLQFEIINLGLSAINSFTVLDWLPDVLKQEPDLIIIYMGHNEFYGALGSGSSISFGQHGRFVRLALTLQKLHLVQMIKTLIQYLTPRPEANKSSTIMEKVIGQKFIPNDSKLRQITYQNFSENLTEILTQCTEKNVPVLLSNLVCNLKDQRPLDSYSQKTSDALKQFRNALQALSQGDSSKARLLFQQARDLDAIPFRAPSPINQIIAHKAQSKGVYFVDMQKAFTLQAKNGIPGKKLFCDHLHPNPTGYKLMANAFHRVICQTGLLSSTALGTNYHTNPLFVTDLDWEIGAIRIFKLQHSWPFSLTNQVNFNNYRPLINQTAADIAMAFLFKHHVWGKAHSEMASYYEKNNQLDKACQEYQAILAMYPQKTNYYVKLLACAKKLKDWPLVKSTCEQALQWTANKGLFLYNLALAERLLGNPQQALQFIKQASKAPELKRQQRSQVFYTYARILLDLRQVRAAQEILRALVKEDPQFKKARLLLEQLTKKNKK